MMRSFISRMWPDMLLSMVFVVSGFVKALDPVGLSYKIEEYLGMFQLSGWSGLSMLLSVLLCAAELTLGLLLLLRLWRKLTAVVLTLFILGFTILTYSIYTDPYGGINECGCFGEAVHLSNGATFAKNLILLVVAGFHLWNVFRQAGNDFNYRQLGLAAGVLVLGFFVPLYAYFYLPPFDFLPYNVGSEIEAENAIHLYDTGFNEVSDQVFSGGKPTYMIGIKEKITPEVGDKLAALYEAYRDGTVNLFGVASGSGMTIPGYADIPVYFMDEVVLKSVLRTPVGVVAFADDRIVGKWNLLYTPYRFERGYGEELSRERWKRGAFFSGWVVMLALLFYERKKRTE